MRGQGPCCTEYEVVRVAERSNYVAFDSPARRGADRGGASPTASHEQAQPSTKVNTTACPPVSSQRPAFLTR